MDLLFLYNTHLLTSVLKFMSIQINYKNSHLNKKFNNFILFVDENFKILELKKYLLKSDYSLIEDLLKINNKKKNITFFDVN